MRALLVVAAVLVFLAGVQLYVFPTRTDEWFAWTIGSPMTAVFLGASYWSAVGLELTGAMARGWSTTRVAVPAVFVFTSLTFVVTMVHLGNFHLEGSFPGGTRAVTWAWIVVYAVVPLLMLVAWAMQASAGTDVHPPTGLPGAVRVVLGLLALGLLGLGTLLLLFPEQASGLWPWPLTPLTGRAVGAWLVGLGVAAGHSLRIDDGPSLVPVGVTGVVFGVLQAIALLRHGDELDWAGAPAYAYVAMLVGVTAVSVWLLVLGRGAAWRAAPQPPTGGERDQRSRRP
jgi:hypothetical protein